MAKESKMIKLPPYQMSIIIGLLLSDGWTIIPSKTSKNARLGFAQSRDNSKYFWNVFWDLSHYCSAYPIIRYRTRFGMPTVGLEFFTRSLPCFTELHSLFYPTGIKIVPHNIYELLTPIALAHLIMGDGSIKNTGLIICTDSFTIQDVVRLINVLILRYELKCTLHKSSNGLGYRIYISKSSVSKVVNIVKPHFIPSMYYKIGIN